MKKILLFGLLFLSLSWQFFLPVNTAINYTIGSLFLICGIVVTTLAFLRNGSIKVDNKWVLLLIPFFFILILVPIPYSLGVLLLSCALFLQVLKMFVKIVDTKNMCFLGLFFSGIIVSVQLLFYPFYSLMTAHFTQVDLLQSIFSYLFNQFGWMSSVNNNVLIIQTYQQNYLFTITVEKLGFLFWLNILIGIILITVSFFKREMFFRNIVCYVLVSIPYLVLRYIMLLAVYIQTHDLSIFWNPFVTFLSFIPLSVILYFLFRGDTPKIEMNWMIHGHINARHILGCFMIFLFVFSAVGTFAYYDPGVEKNGRILIDEYHSDWENTTEKMDHTWFGVDSVYNYYSWAEWLDTYYNISRNIDQPLTKTLLYHYDIVVLKCPTKPYSDEEINDIVQYVNAGGGLFLIGDHTNLYGMNFYLNQIAQHFGIWFNNDATFELETNNYSIYYPSSLFPHPIVQNLHQLNFLTSCTLNAPINSENVILGNNIASEPGIYSSENFIRDVRSLPDANYGSFLQSVAIKQGLGRVVAFTDSTCFSNFCVFMNGYSYFSLGTFEYLNRINVYDYFNLLFFVLSLISFLGLTIIIKFDKNKILLIFLILVIGSFSFSLSSFAITNYNEENYQLPSPQKDSIKIYFDVEYSDIVIDPKNTIAPYEYEKSYSTFFVWAQRMGCFPSVCSDLEESFRDGDIVVMINPQQSFSDQELELIDTYLTHGGCIFILDSILNTHSTANEVLQYYGMNIMKSVSYETLYTDSHKVTDIGKIGIPYLSIIGGDIRYISQNDSIFISSQNVHAGKVVVMVDSYTFCDLIIGKVFDEPNEKQLAIHNCLYYIYNTLLLPAD